MKERTYTAPMSVHVTAAELAEIDRAAAESGTSRSRFVKSTLKREVERLDRLKPSASSSEIEVAG